MQDTLNPIKIAPLNAPEILAHRLCAPKAPDSPRQVSSESRQGCPPPAGSPDGTNFRERPAVSGDGRTGDDNGGKALRAAVAALMLLVAIGGGAFVAVRQGRAERAKLMQAEDGAGRPTR